MNLPGLIQQMQTPVCKGALDDQFGITWFIRDVGTVRTISHGGATLGQQALLTIAPAQKFAVALLTNSSRGAELNRTVSNWAFKHYLNAAQAEPTHLEMSAAQLAPYAGRYTAAATDIELSLRDGGLMLQAIPKGGFPAKESKPGPTPPPVRLAFCAADRVVALDAPNENLQGEFLRNPDSSLAWFRWGSRIHRRVT